MAYNQKIKNKRALICTIYSPEVLIGNWFQERMSGLQNDVHAITPGIYGQSGCIDGKTTYKSDYLEPVAKDDPRGADDFINVKIIRFRNKMKNKETNIQQCNDIFLHNMTSMADLQYRILPETSRGLLGGNDWMLKKNPKKELTRNYGNQTNFGLLKAKRCDELRELQKYRHLSETKSNFGLKIRIPLTPTNRKCSGNL
uniref:Uncharacterized protein n=2 Tax=Bactrocera latifrons TaxID=174628 RepID=A0A0K8UG23_BACLA